MAEEGGAGEGAERSEAATPRRIERAREEGQVPLSKELVGWVTLASATLAAALALPMLGPGLMRAMRAALARGHELGMAEALASLLGFGAMVVVPVAVAASLGAVAATLGQTGGLVSAKPLAPALAKISPLAGFKRLFGMDALVEFLRTLLKLAVVGAALWHVGADLRGIAESLYESPAALPASAGAVALRLMMAALIAFGGLAALDFLWVRFRHLQLLKMSRQDLREEARDAEGDPTMKARRRQMRLAQGRQRMMAAVPKAAVVITNPTHYAVALSYEAGEAAPRVVAKGVDAMAARIRAAAEAASVPLVANPPLCAGRPAGGSG